MIVRTLLASTHGPAQHAPMEAFAIPFETTRFLAVASRRCRLVAGSDILAALSRQPCALKGTGILLQDSLDGLTSHLFFAFLVQTRLALAILIAKFTLLATDRARTKRENT